MSIRDNQQVTSGWFAGILEGEGSFRNSKKDNVCIQISNTNLDIIQACQTYLEKNNIYYSLIESHRRNKRNRKTEYSIVIRKSRNVIFNYPELLYRLLEDKLECRRKEYQKILETSETIRDLSVDLDWLIGIFEAEGSFSIVLNNRNIAAFKIDIANTNELIIWKVDKILASIRCGHHLETKRHEKDYHKQCYSMNIYGMKRCKRFLEATEGMWIASRNIKRTSLMLEFIRTRLAMWVKEPYNERQLQIIQTMRDLNR